MKKIQIILLLTLPFLWMQCNSSKPSTGKTSSSKSKSAVHFVKSDKLSDVLEEAGSNNKLVFVDFHASWCAPCKLMDKDVFTDKSIGKFFNENFVSYKVDVDKGNGANIAALYEVTVLPTLLFLDKNGRVLEKKEGAAYQTELRRLAENALANPGG